MVLVSVRGTRKINNTGRNDETDDKQKIAGELPGYGAACHPGKRLRDFQP